MSELKGFIDRDDNRYELVTETILNEALEAKADVSHSHNGADVALSPILINKNDGNNEISSDNNFIALINKSNNLGRRILVVVRVDVFEFLGTLSCRQYIDGGIVKVGVSITVGSTMFMLNGTYDRTNNRYTWDNNGILTTIEYRFVNEEEA
jgi:hypothetical protein